MVRKEPTVDSNTHEIADLLNFATGEAEGSQIPEHQMVICAASLEFITVLGQGGSECLSIGDDLFGIDTERRLGYLKKSCCNSGNGLSTRLVY